MKEYRPLHVPHKYDAAASLQDNVVFALAQLEYATAGEVADKLIQFEQDADAADLLQRTEEILTHLFDKGHIKGNNDTDRQYNLSKILVQNSGKADPLY